MNRSVVAASLVVVLGLSAVATAQTGAGSLRGYNGANEQFNPN